MFSRSPRNMNENIETNKSVHTDLINNVIDIFSTSFNRKTNEKDPIKNVRPTAITKYLNAFLLLFMLNFLPFTIKNNSRDIDTMKNTIDFVKTTLNGLV